MSEDFRLLIIRKMRDLGGDTDTNTVSRGAYAEVAPSFDVHQTTVKKYLGKYRLTGEVKAMPKSNGRKKFSEMKK